MACENKYYTHYTPEQLDRTITLLADRYAMWRKQYQWAIDHPNKYTVDEATYLERIKEAAFAQMRAIIPEFVDEAIKVMMAETFAEAEKKYNPTLKIRLAQWIQRRFRK